MTKILKTYFWILAQSYKGDFHRYSGLEVVKTKQTHNNHKTTVTKGLLNLDLHTFSWCWFLPKDSQEILE